MIGRLGRMSPTSQTNDKSHPLIKGIINIIMNTDTLLHGPLHAPSLYYTISIDYDCVDLLNVVKSLIINFDEVKFVGMNIINPLHDIMEI